jgi:hypothetical protein
MCESPWGFEDSQENHAWPAFSKINSRYSASTDSSATPSELLQNK